MTEGVANKGGKRNLPVRERVGDITKRKQVVAGKHQITQHREHESQQKANGGQFFEAPHDLMVVVLPKFKMQHPQSSGKEKNADERAKIMQKFLPHAYS
jgi:hypothetical protein